jgi:hypothetical protein
MFEYADERKVKMRIGNYVAHHIVQERPFSKIVRSPDQLNRMDRYELAKAFLASGERKYFDRDLRHTPDPEKMLDDIARYIDQRIPKAYATWSDYDSKNTGSQEYVNTEKLEWSAAALGLIYQFPENAELEQSVKDEAKAWNRDVIPATKKQIRYLKTLLSRSGYVLKIGFDELTVDQASQLISFFVNDTHLPEELYRFLEYDV